MPDGVRFGRMFKSLKPFNTWLALVLCVAVAAVGSFRSGAVSRAQGTTAQTRPLTPQEKRGKTIYQRGESPSGREMTAVVGEVDLPASTLTCAGCHGARGEGKTAGGVTAGALDWSHLVKPHGHTHPSGRRHGPFKEASFARSVREGFDPDGNELFMTMPRYKMSDEDVADLVAYLKRVGDEPGAETTKDGTRIDTDPPARRPPAEKDAAPPVAFGRGGTGNHVKAN